MYYEHRKYRIMPGKAADLHRRFAEVTNPLFERHGFRVVGYWNETIGEGNCLHYLLGWEDLNERDAKWAAFQGDSTWQEARLASEVGGPLVERIDTAIWRPTPYSPLQ